MPASRTRLQGVGELGAFVAEVAEEAVAEFVDERGLADGDDAHLLDPSDQVGAEDAAVLQTVAVVGAGLAAERALETVEAHLDRRGRRWRGSRPASRCRWPRQIARPTLPAASSPVRDCSGSGPPGRARETAAVRPISEPSAITLREPIRRRSSPKPVKMPSCSRASRKLVADHQVGAQRQFARPPTPPGRR